jgi:predicted RNA-binding Zn ribbon-like protein
MSAYLTPLTGPADSRITLLDLALGGPGPDAVPPRTPHPADTRPLLGEPLALDLLNTRWDTPDGPADLLADADGHRIWLASAGLADRCTADPASRAATRQARAALHAAARAPRDPQALAAVDRLLEHGALRHRLTPTGPSAAVEVDDPAWLAGWLALDDYLHLLAAAPERIRSCAGPHRLPVWFYDTSRNGMRRWCSMAGCGNRAKAARYQRRAQVAAAR